MKIKAGSIEDIPEILKGFSHSKEMLSSDSKITKEGITIIKVDSKIWETYMYEVIET